MKEELGTRREGCSPAGAGAAMDVTLANKRVPVSRTLDFRPGGSGSCCRILS